MAEPIVYLAELTVSKGAYDYGKLYKLPLSREPKIVGRSDKCYIQILEDDTVSKEHGVFFHNHQNLVFLMIKGRNPVYVGSLDDPHKEIIYYSKQKQIAFGEVITFGEKEYKLQLIDSLKGKKILERRDKFLRDDTKIVKHNDLVGLVNSNY